MSNPSNSDPNVRIDITASADGVAPGVDKAQGDLDRLAQSTSTFEQKQRAAIETSDRMASVTGRTREQFLQLGKEVVTGDTSRMPNTMASIAMSMLPVAGGIAAIAGAIAAGVWAWNEWGNSAQDAAKKAADELKKATDAANKAQHQNTQEKIQQDKYRIESIHGEIAVIDIQIAKLQELRRLNPSDNKKYADQIGVQYQIRGEKQREEYGLNRDIFNLQQPGNKKDEAHQEAINKEIERERSKYEKLHEMAILADSEDAYRITWKLAFDLKAMEKEHAEAVRMRGKNAELDQAYEQARLDRIAAANSEAEKLAKIHEAKEEKIRQDKMRSELSVANFSRLLRQGDFTDAMTMAEKMTAGMATKSRAAFEVNKAASLAKATVQGYQAITAAFADGMSWGSYYGAIAEAALATAFVMAQLDAINSTQFGGGGVSVPSGGGVPSQATLPGVPVTQTPAAQQTPPVTVNIYNTGTFVDAQQFVDNTVIPQIKDAVQNRDVLLIDPRSRQAAALGAG